MQYKQEFDKKANTDSHMVLQDTISAPNVKLIIKAVANIVHSLITDGNKQPEISEKHELYFFSEEKYMKDRPEEFDELRKSLLREVPQQENIYEFLKALYDCAKFSPECCIIALVYINRLIVMTEMSLKATNWRPLMLCALLVAQKVWDDVCLTTFDFSFIYPFFDNEELKMLESKFLNLLQFKVHVTTKLYAKYYYELRDMIKNDEALNFKPLDAKGQLYLDERSKRIEEEEIKKYEQFSKTLTLQGKSALSHSIATLKYQ